MGKEVLGSDKGPFTDPIQKNYSLRRACFSTSKDTYMLHGLFPRLSRGLKRKLSQEMAVATVLEAVGGVAGFVGPSGVPTPTAEGLVDNLLAEAEEEMDEIIAENTQQHEEAPPGPPEESQGHP